MLCCLDDQVFLIDDSQTLADVLSGIHLMRVVTQSEMLGLLNTIETWLDQHDKVSHCSCSGFCMLSTVLERMWMMRVCVNRSR